MIVLSALMVTLAANPAFAREPVKPKSSNPKAQELIDKAWDAVGTDLTIETADRAIGFLDEALKINPENPEILVAIADECWQRADLMPKKKDEDYKARNFYFNRSMDYAKKSLEIKETAGGHYWYCASLASAYENRGTFAQAGIFLDLNKHMEWIQENDITYLYGGYARFWGQVLSRVPSVVVRIVGEDPSRLYAELENAIKIEPGYLLNYTYQGEFLHSMEKKEEALEALKKAIEGDPNALPQELAKNKLAQKRARKDWKEFTGKEYPNK